MTRSRIAARHLALAALSIPALLLTACGGDEDSASPGTAPPGGSTPSGEPAPSEGQAQETDSASPRLAATYDGGVFVIDGDSLDVLETFEFEGFNRLNPAGDGRHVILSTAEAFRVIDTGAWSREHGDHQHHYVQDPRLTDIEFETEHPGHVVRHAGRTVLFSDGTGRVESFESDALADGAPETDVYTTDQPHHGVAVELENGELLVTLGDEETRSGIMVLDAERNEITRNEDCPGVHGEAMAAGEAAVVGCEDGVLVYKDGTITKIDSPDPYGRIGNQAGSEESTVVLGDYKVDPDAELERPERISLIDTATHTLRHVDLGTSYSFRSLARGPHGEALILGTDGAIHVIDPDAAEVTSTIPVVDEWTEPTEWQQPRPTITVVDHTAYVTQPSSDEIHAVDIENSAVVESATLPATPNELTSALG